MKPIGSVLALALGLSTFPQAAFAAAPAGEPAGPAAAGYGIDTGAVAPVLPERRARIILMRDGVVVGSSQPEAEAPAAPAGEAEVQAAPLAPLSAPAPEPAPAPAAPAAEAGAASPWTPEELRTPLAAGEGWRIQVGAFRDAGRAEARIAELELTAAGPGADPIRHVVPAVEAQGSIYRAQMSGFVDRAAADGACARLTAAGAACFVVAPAP